MSKIVFGIAEDHATVRDVFVNEVIQQLGCTIIASSSNGADFLKAIKAANQIPHIVSIDLSMPIMNGYDTIKQMRLLYPSTKILVFTYVAELDAIINLFNLGVNGFGFLNNQHYKSNQLATLDWNKYSFIGKNKFSHKEVEFIQFNIQTFFVTEIAKHWCCSEKNVDYYRNKIYNQLHISSRIELVQYAKKFGYEN